MPMAPKTRNRPPSSSGTRRFRCLSTGAVGALGGILVDATVPGAASSPLSTLQSYRRRVQGRSWRLRKAGRGRPRHARAIFAKYRSDRGRPVVPLWPPRSLRSSASMRMAGAKRAPLGLPRGLSRQAAAEYIGVGTTLFDTMVRDGRMPPPFRVGARVIWDRRKLDDAFDVLSDQDEDRNPWDEPAAA